MGGYDRPKSSSVKHLNHLNHCVNSKTLNIATLNVCGLRKRSQYPDFVEYFDRFDLICFVETKLEDIDVISIPGFQCFSQPRKQKYIRKSGGIALFAKDKFFEHCKYLVTDSDYIMWVSVDRSIASTEEDLIIGITYVPPSQSRFFNDDELQTLENEITSMCSSHKYVFITGDLNARTARLSDYVQLDEFLAETFELDDETINFFNKTTILEQLKIPLNRTSNDTKTNNAGYWLMNVCKNNNLFIVNGRVGKDKNIGNKTFRDQSVIDYTLCTADCFYLLQQFEIIELDEFFSDGHSLLSWSLNMNSKHTT
ncbi:MAG: endonuclease/exonuclease/phosphatase family protein [Candidatus Thiodiazotropha sp.]